MRSLCILLAIAFCPMALAEGVSVTVSHPALGGYCLQYTRHVLSQMQEDWSAVCGNQAVPKSCTRLKAIFSSEKHTFELWRMYALSLGISGASDFLRGIAQANADIAYINDATASLLSHLPPGSSDKDVKKHIASIVASDPRVQAIRLRVATCENGPPL